ncbi:uncharacterized protein LOC132269618 [Cornus florida]|uniref:uncharacterized protein LOC132269618 n=1 Tax=Cornus florida TaxID=4283 RepID=UPI0028A0DCD8|nr:uncharacterized protein LOC132269618 [Cornus florida]
MSWLKLGKKLLPARKAWKVFTTKLQTKLHKLHRSKAIKKPKKRLGKTTNKAALWHAFSLQPRFKREKRYHHHHHYRVHNKPAPVFIDELFIEPVPIVKEYLQQPTTAEASKKAIVQTPPSANKTKLANQQADVPGTSIREPEGHEKMHTADDMWESLALASPQMHEINERAEEFITRFRGEMQLQETMARHL